ncbi:MAG: hypothetical protein WCA56_03305 [Xanthobacteraceae bacterium]
MSASPHHGEITHALAALQALMAASAPLPATSKPAAQSAAAGEQTAALHAEHLALIAQELDAVSAGTAQATQKVLAAAEEIDQLADNLSAALRGRVEQELAQDISDLVIRIFEACNFQDLIGQRIAKVMKTLAAREAAPMRAEDAAPDLHGPRLDRDKGHMSQDQIDALFGG